MISSGVNLVMTVIGFAVSTMFIVFVCTRLICARIHLNATRRSFARASRSDLSMLERGLHGLEPMVVANFPTRKYIDAFFPSAQDAQCTVCLSEYQDEDTLRILPTCGHFFHATCIDIWFQQQSTCPVCRVSLREISEKKRFMQPMFSSAFRSQYGLEPCHCMSAGHRAPLISNDGQRMNSIQEVYCLSEADGRVQVRERNSMLTDNNNVMKAVENKRAESPSSA